jgi:rhamnulokinase
LTGIQFLQINTLYQLLALEGSPQMEIARTLLLMPDLMNYWLTGKVGAEFTNVTTTQLYDAGNGEWCADLLQAMRIPRGLFPDVTSPGTVFAPLLPSIAEEAGVRPTIPVISTGSHDTASAVVAVPARTVNFAYISSGTWSLVGLELSERIVTDAAMGANFTNEGGFAGTNRFLKNVMGLWLLQESRSTWKHSLHRDYSYEELVGLSQAAPPLRSIIDPDVPEFLPPGDMPARIRAFCQRTGQGAPETPGELVRCILESLAVKYRLIIDEAERLSGRRVDVIHIVGGGSRNEFLCQATADATGRPVVAGPVEATAMGNTLGQAHALGYLSSLAEMREVVRNSVVTQHYEPSGVRAVWDEAAWRLEAIISGRSQSSGDSETQIGASESLENQRSVTKQRVVHG